MESIPNGPRTENNKRVFPAVSMSEQGEGDLKLPPYV